MNSQISVHRDANLMELTRILAWTTMLLLAAASWAHGTTIYSGASVGGNGTIYGWGVTDAYYPGMNHTPT